MQLPLQIWDHASPLEQGPSVQDRPDDGWAARPFGGALSGPDHPRRIGLIATVGVHLALLGALLIRFDVVAPLMPEPIVFTQIMESKTEEVTPLPPEPDLKPTKLDLNRVVPPQIDEPTNAITEPVPVPPPRAAPSKSALETYQARLFRHLDRHKRYPADAQRRRDQGVVMLAFTIDEAGRVLDRHITTSSGFPALDAEALAMLDRANPVPAPPEGMIRGQGEVVIPVEFSLQR